MEVSDLNLLVYLSVINSKKEEKLDQEEFDLLIEVLENGN